MNQGWQFGSAISGKARECIPACSPLRHCDLEAMKEALRPVLPGIFRLLACVLLAALLSGCSALSFTYNNADFVARYKASDYVDFNPAQSEQFRKHFASIHQWHRTNELPAYAELLRAVAARVGRGLVQDDVTWAISTTRSHFRRLMGLAVREAGPVLASLDAGQLQQVEKRFSENNRRFVRENLEGDRQQLREKRVKQLEDYFREWIGRPTDQQRARIEQFADEFGRIRAVRFADRKQTQQAFLAAMRAERDPVRLSQRVSALVADPDGGRSQEYRVAMAQFEGRVATLIIDMDRMLTVEQRARAVKRFHTYADELLELSSPARSVAAAVPPGS